MEFQEGVFFGLSEDDYFSVPALSASGVKNLRMSPLDFWARAAWLNPNHEEENGDAEESFARTLGKAYHKRILEGRDAFFACYAPELEPWPGMLRTDEDLKNWLCLSNLSQAGKRKQERIDRILEAQPSMAGRIWECALDAHAKKHEGKTFLPRKHLDKIELAAAMIERDPHLGKAFIGGMPEVSIFWVCPTHGIPCKARLDYIKPKAIVDLKTVTNKGGYPFPRALERELSYNRYPIQAAWYYEASDQISGLVRAGKIYGDAPSNLVSALLAGHDKTFLYVFQQKGVAPLAAGRTFPREMTTCAVAAAQCDAAKQVYRQCVETFGSDPWLVPQPIVQFDESQIPALWE